MNIENLKNGVVLVLLAISFGNIIFQVLNRFTEKNVLSLIDEPHYDII